MRASLGSFANSDYFLEAGARLGDAAGRGRNYVQVTVYSDSKLDAFSFSDGSVFISRGMIASMEDSEPAVLGLIASLACRSFERQDVRMLKGSLFNFGELL
ncbi:MAG TPA: hypothetical protein PLL10_02180, partial [Elusimicrobiales bacterium]|nr:hypothetical protein [Elusimicrobiales bacterium]